MRLTVFLYLTIVFTPVVGAAQQDHRLEGCVDPGTIATVLRGLRQEKSRSVSEEQFRAMWPVELADAEVNPPPNTRSFRSDDRILRGHYQCGEVFTFKLHQEGRTTLLELDSVTVNYSARRRETLVAMAKLFAQTIGLGASDLRTVGTRQSQDYHLEKFRGAERRHYLIDLRLSREAGLWKLHFYAAFYVIER